MNFIKLLLINLLLASCNGIYIHAPEPKLNRYFPDSKKISEIPINLKGKMYFGRPYMKGQGNPCTDLVMNFTYDSTIFTGYYSGPCEDANYPGLMMDLAKTHKGNQKSYITLNKDSTYTLSLLVDDGFRYHFIVYNMIILNQDSLQLEFNEIRGLKRKYVKTDTLFLEKKFILKKYSDKLQ